jgi:hypothetical protein
MLRLHTQLRPGECVRQMAEATGAHSIGYHPRRLTADGTIMFGLEKRRSLLSSSPVAPYFYGMLLPDPSATGGTIILGSFGFHPRARGGVVTVAVIASMAFGLALYWGEQQGIEWVVLALAVGIAGLFLTRWIRRGDKRDITTFLTGTLQARHHDWDIRADG